VGRGLARHLVATTSCALASAGTMPFLHVSPQNTRAIRLYEQNGYVTRTAIAFWSLARRGV
jgi:predicted GNAT family acetyltransferase